jgi:hypothetical protein
MKNVLRTAALAALALSAVVIAQPSHAQSIGSVATVRMTPTHVYTPGEAVPSQCLVRGFNRDPHTHAPFPLVQQPNGVLAPQIVKWMTCQNIGAPTPYDVMVTVVARNIHVNGAPTPAGCILLPGPRNLVTHQPLYMLEYCQH